MFVHLNTHSVYSEMSGLLPVKKLIQLSKVNGMGSLALTDVNCLSGFINFVKYCNSMEVKPIAGANLIAKSTSKDFRLRILFEDPGKSAQPLPDSLVEPIRWQRLGLGNIVSEFLYWKLGQQ